MEETYQRLLGLLEWGPLPESDTRWSERAVEVWYQNGDSPRAPTPDGPPRIWFRSACAAARQLGVNDKDMALLLKESVEERKTKVGLAARRTTESRPLADHLVGRGGAV